MACQGCNREKNVFPEYLAIPTLLNYRDSAFIWYRVIASPGKPLKYIYDPNRINKGSTS